MTALFEEADLYGGDPLRPDLITVTPVSVIAALTRTQREERVRNLIEQAHLIYDHALEVHLRGGKTLAASAVLFSGGNDSTVLAHLFRERVTHAIHANTTIGIEQTRQFVRDTCAEWGLDLLEKTAPESYRSLVLERGFPGPAMHFIMYTRLKERCLEAARNELVDNPRRERILYVAGRRREESRRRADIPLHERKGSVIWASPLAMWTSLDMTTYRLMHPDCPWNQVSRLIHMSGECLCGAFARRDELDEIGYWFPEVKAEIEALEAEVRAAGHQEPWCRWGHHAGKQPEKPTGPMCSSCDDRFDFEDAS